MNTVFKYSLELKHFQEIEMPMRARILHVALQRGVLTLWARVDTQIANTTRTIHVVGTGHDVDPNWKHLGSCLTPDDQFVWHVFEG